jgi:hypothetical protein
MATVTTDAGLSKKRKRPDDGKPAEVVDLCSP